MDIESLVIQLSLDAGKLQEGISKAQDALHGMQSKAQDMAQRMGNGLSGVKDSTQRAGGAFNDLGRQAHAAGQQAQQAISQFSHFSDSLFGRVKGFISSFAAPLAGLATIGATVGGYFSDLQGVAKELGVINEKEEEQRKKRELLSRVTKEDIELYKKGRDALAKMEYAVRGVGNELMRTFLPYMQKGVEWLNKASDWVRANSDNIVRFVKVLGGVIATILLPAIIRTTAALLANPLTWIIALIAALALVIDDLVVYIQGGESALSGFWSKFGTGEEIGNKLKAVWETVVAVWDKCKGTLAAFIGVFVGFKAIQKAIGFVSAFIGVLRNLMAVIAANPLGLLVLAVADLISYIVTGNSLLEDFWKEFGTGEEIAASLAAIWETLKTTGVELFETLVSGAKKFFSYFKDAIEPLKNIFKGLFDLIKGIVHGDMGEIVTALGDILNNFLGYTLSMAKGAFNLITDIIGSFAEWASNKITEAFGSIGGFLEYIWDSILDGVSAIWDGIKYLFGVGWDFVVKATSDAWNNIVSFVSNIAPNVVKAVSNAWNSVKKWTSDTWESVKTSVSKAWDGIKNFITNIGPAIFAAISNLWNRAVKATSEAWEAVKRSVSNAWDNIKAKVTNAASAIANFVSQTWEDLKQSASEKWESVKRTVSEKWQSMKDTIANLGPAIASKAKEVWENIKTSAAESWENVKSTVSEKWQSVQNTISELGPAIVQKVSDTWNSIKESAGQAWEGIKATVAEKWNGLVDTISNLGPAIISACQSLWSNITSFWDGLSLAESGRKLLQTFIDGVKAMASSVVDAVSGVFSKVREYLPFSDAHVGPLSQLTLSGQRMMTTFGEGAEQGESELLAKVSSIFGGVKDAFSDFFGFGSKKEQPEQKVEAAKPVQIPAQEITPAKPVQAPSPIIEPAKAVVAPAQEVKPSPALQIPAPTVQAQEAIKLPEISTEAPSPITLPTPEITGQKIAISPEISMGRPKPQEQREESGFGAKILSSLGSFAEGVADALSGNGIVDGIKGVFSGFSDIPQSFKEGFDGIKADFAEVAKMFAAVSVPQGADFAMAGVAPSITEATNNNTTNTTVTTNVNGVTINTQATDAQGIAASMPNAMKGAFNRAGTSASMSGVRQ